MADSALVIVSNRGPVAFTEEPDGSVSPRRGAGGLVSGLGPLVVGTDTVWIAAALSHGDRQAASGGIIDAEGFKVRTLALDPDDFRLAYDVVCNATLWFLYHGLFDLAREPTFDRGWWAAWDAYRRINRAFAEAIVDAAPEGGTVLVQDYHLSLLGPHLAERRPDLRTVHFSHTPFATPALFELLPDAIQQELLDGISAHHACGFHTQRWAEDFTRSCEIVLGRLPNVFVSPLAPDPADIKSVAASKACEDALIELDDQLAGRMLITRVDRIELSKNLLRGFQAFDDLLHEHPELRGQVVFGAFGYPSREGVEAYARYRDAVEEAVADINRRWAIPGWTPILYDASDNFPRSIAALRRADVLLVNPIRDGLNLVAKEGAMVNERDAMLLLSTEAGAWEELEPVAIGLNPYDVRQTSEALHRALLMSQTERRTRAAALRELAGARTAADWLADQLRAAAT